jgi:hypothetical protein
MPIMRCGESAARKILRAMLDGYRNAESQSSHRAAV